MTQCPDVRIGALFLEDMMKNILAINETAAAGQPDGAVFLTKCADRGSIQKMRAVHRQGMELRAYNGTMLWLGLLRWGCFLLAVLGLGDLLRQEISLAEFVQQRGFPGTVGLLLLFLMTFPLGSFLKKQHQAKVVITASSMQEELGIEPGSTMLPLLWYTYQETDGRECRREWAWMQCFTAVQDGCLCISNLTMRFEIPLSSFTAFRTAAEKAILQQNGSMTEVPYAIAEIRDARGDFMLCVPEQSAEQLRQMIGL